MRENLLRKIWRSGGAAVNGWLAIPNSFSAEAMAQQGWDSLTIDLQHGAVDYHAMLPMLQAISTTPTVPVVRVPWLEPGIVMKALDAGAYGIICPMVETRRDVENLVAWTHYPPRGSRSYGPVRAALYAGGDYLQQANDTVVVLAMIETAAALERIDDIASVEGLDGVYIGPSDLSLGLGFAPPGLGDPAPRVEEAIAHVLARAKAHRVIAGIHNLTVASARKRVAQGFHFVTVASDMQLMATAARDVVDAMRRGGSA